MALQYQAIPLNHASIVARHMIPVMHIVSENDRVVPPKENSYVLQKRLAELGHSMEIISVAEGTQKSNGHHFTHPDPNKVVEFILRHTDQAR